MQKQTILFFSNPFGYGPTTTLLHIAEKLSKKTKAKMIVAGDNKGLCKEVFNKNNHPYLSWHDLNERNLDEVKSFIASHDNPYVVSILNRFSIKAAQELGVKNALIDFLAWFWDKPSEEYSLADIYFYNSLGKKIEVKNRISYDVPIILGEIPRRSHSKKKKIIINIGGSKNPLVKGIPKDYLNLLAKIINKLKFGDADVYIGGGKEALTFLKSKLVKPENFTIKSFPHEEFLKLHASCDCFITLSGTNATFMSFTLGIPTTFLLPQLLAHWKLSFLIQDQNVNEPLMWEDYFNIDKKMYSLTEYDVVPYTEKLSRELIADSKKFELVTDQIQHDLDFDKDVKKQTDYMKRIGINGEDFVANVLSREWGLI